MEKVICDMLTEEQKEFIDKCEIKIYGGCSGDIVKEQDEDLTYCNQQRDGKPVLVLCTNCGEYNPPSIKCYCHKRSKRVARLISNAL